MAETEVIQREALERIKQVQPKTLAMIRRSGFSFVNLGAEPGNWEHLAFTLYSTICEIDSIVSDALDEEV